MIVSHKHKFIFLHNRKAAGSSVTVALAPHLGTDDIMIGCVGDCRANGIFPPRRMAYEALLHPSRKAAIAHLPKASFWKFVSTSNKNYYEKIIGPVPAHARAAELRNAFSKEWTQYTKFCVVRNPWTKTASDYFWRTKKYADPPSFSEYVTALSSGQSLGGIVHRYHNNWDGYTIDDKIAADKIIRFENLENDFGDIMKFLDLEWDRSLTNSKKNAKSSNGHRVSYREMYTSEIREKVDILYRKEIEFFNYEFPE